MSFFKKLFSKKKEHESSTEEPKVVERTKEKTTDEVIGMEIDFGDNKVYPYFMPYENHELQEGQLASVFHYSQDQKPVVLQTIVLQDDEGLGLMDNSEMSEVMLESIDTQAQANINAYEIEFKFHPEFPESVIAAQGPMFTCETILSEEHMLKAHVMLDAEEIMVAIPRRGVILVAANDLADEMRQAFLGLHMYIWNDQKDKEGDLSRICKDIFVLKHGSIEGVLYLDL